VPGIGDTTSTTLSLVQTGTTLTGTYVELTFVGNGPVTYAATGTVVGQQVSLTLKQTRKPKLPAAFVSLTLSADSTTMTGGGGPNGAVMVFHR
jgi:hypothetical protein